MTLLLIATIVSLLRRTVALLWLVVHALGLIVVTLLRRWAISLLWWVVSLASLVSLLAVVILRGAWRGSGVAAGTGIVVALLVRRRRAGLMLVVRITR